MTLQWLEGFDGAADLVTRYGNTAQEWSQVTGRYGVGQARQPQGTLRLTLADGAATKVITGLAMQRGGSNLGLLTFFGDAGATQHITLSMTDATTGLMTLYRGNHGGTSLATATVSKFGSSNQWGYLEMSVTINDTTGNVIVKVDGTTVINFTGDTKNGGTASTIDTIGMFNTGMFVDDWYVLNDSGSAPMNDFLGEKRVYTIRPSAAGSSTGWTPDSGSNYARVNEQPSSASNYVSTSAGAAGTRDMYTLDDLPASATGVLAVAVNVMAKKSDAGAANIKTAVRTSSTNYDGSSIALSASDQVYQQRWTLNPNTSAAWSVSDINGMEAGVVTA